MLKFKAKRNLMIQINENIYGKILTSHILIRMIKEFKEFKNVIIINKYSKYFSFEQRREKTQWMC